MKVRSVLDRLPDRVFATAHCRPSFSFPYHQELNHAYRHCCRDDQCR
ncbi:hypothetical protein H6G52_00560 [Limnothrix sp. FACHB-881]|uniref:Uncharacterized protein n=1 Tax=Limnothrix redekei LRLZ20PSL1 TaxID=3112953 RepID=A0ABW7C860_9CYAN|nr:MULTISPECIES: hypothetical protein [unclassified Limnothrix]MBD2191233.1 hypothetical protein [Limnothrix sp. FACHB-1088]MBD2633839.1 hypothetical protein [Limnothrix sp. FACHB-881]